MYLLNNSFIECIVRSLNLFSCASISHLAVFVFFFFIRGEDLSINSGIRPTINRLLELIYKLQVVCTLRRQTSAECVHLIIFTFFLKKGIAE